MRYQRSETEPMALGILAGLAVLLLAAVALGCASGCTGYTYLASEPRTLEQRADTVVKVETLCVTADPFTSGTIGFRAGLGSGVMIDARRILTAAHVVECSYLPDVHVITANGSRHRVVVTRSNLQTDLALLEIASGAEDFGGIAPPAVGARPQVGDAICKLQAFPARGADCGTVTDLNDELDSDVGHDAPVQHGNSGGPVYDADGRLVGITTQLKLPDGTTGGRFTSLAGPRGWEMLP